MLLPGLREAERLLAFRYQDLVMLKNLTGRNLIVQGRVLKHGDFCRIFAGQRILIGDQVLTYQDLVFYFNARKNVSLPQIFVTVKRMTKCAWRRIARGTPASR